MEDEEQPASPGPGPGPGPSRPQTRAATASAKKGTPARRNIAESYPPAKLGTVDEGGVPAGTAPSSEGHGILEIDQEADRDPAAGSRDSLEQVVLVCSTFECRTTKGCSSSMGGQAESSARRRQL